MTKQHLSRTDLAQRWGVSLKTVDRLRTAHKLPWIDISGGRGNRPCVRFVLRDVEAFEERQRRGVQ